MSIRLRIVLLSAALTTLVLMAISGGVYYWFQHSLRQETDVHLRQLSQTVNTQAQLNFTDGQLRLQVVPANPFTYATGIYIQTTDLQGNGQDNVPNVSTFLPLDPQVLSSTVQGHNVYYTTTFLGEPIRVLSVPVVLPGNQPRPVGTLQV